MKKCVASALVVFCMVLSVVMTACSQDTAFNQQAADFQLNDLQGTSFVLEDYIGKNPVLLLFWTTWCPYCQSALTSLKEMNSELEAGGFEVVAVNVKEPSSKVSAFVQRHALPFRVLLDTDMSVARSYGVRGIPAYVVINKSGSIVFRNNYFPRTNYKDLVKE